MNQKSIAIIVGLSICLPAAADLSRNQVRALVREEAGKIKAQLGPRGDRGPEGASGHKGPTSESRGTRGKTGPAGLAGPPGIDAASSKTLFAHVFADGSIDEATAIGITQENVKRSDIIERNQSLITYCLKGLPAPIFGGQITLDATNIGPPTTDVVMPTFHLHVHEDLPDCEQLVIVWDGMAQEFYEGNEAASFYLLLY